MEKALVELTNGDLVEITLPSLTDVLDFVISEESRDDEIVYEAILPVTMAFHASPKVPTLTNR